MTLPGFEVTEISPWQKVMNFGTDCTHAFGIASHSKEQDFHFGDDILLSRHDYYVDVAGGPPATQYVYNIVEVDGLRFPTKRRVYLRGSHLKPIRDNICCKQI